jgi:hypothetical protein
VQAVHAPSKMIGSKSLYVSWASAARLTKAVP